MDFAPPLSEAASPPPLAMVMQAAKSADPTEDRALALWNEGRKEEAIAFLEKQIAEERDAPQPAVAPLVVATPAAPPVAEVPS